MFCTQCGTQLGPNAKFCSKCGVATRGEASATLAPATSKTTTTTPQHVTDTVVHGTKWLTVWIYFYLPVSGVLVLLRSLGLSPLGVIMGVPYAIFHFVVAYGLHYRRLWAWERNWVLIIINFALTLISTLTHEGSGGTGYLVGQLIGGLIFLIIFIWPNYVYWKKRRGLFS